MKPLKIALVHDHLNQIGGAENVLKAFHEIWPDAPVFTLIYDKKEMGNFCDSMNITSSFFQRVPGGKRFFKPLIPFMPTAVERFNMDEFDVVISDSTAFAKGVITKPETLHIDYCHTPTRYLWHDTHGYTAELPTNPVLKNILPFFLTGLRQWDRLAADRVDAFIGNSKNAALRIKKYYKRDADVIYPPFSFEPKEPAPISKVGNYFLTGGRFRPYKRIDLVIRVFSKIGIPLKVFGQGEEEENLKAIAGPNIEFVGPVPDEEKYDLFRHAQAYIHAAEEDFGIQPIEAMAFGRPVIAFGKGGALETIVAGKTGEFFERQTVDSLLNVLRNFRFQNYDPRVIQEHAKSFSTDRFKKEIKEYVEKKYEEHKKQFLI
jgi:glycosyltransferase involved in cell wall biosynthesis